MKTKDEIEKFVVSYGINNSDAVNHFSTILSEVQLHIFYKVPTSKFVQLCANEQWDYALGIADWMNKEILNTRTLYPDFVKMIKTSGEYISKVRKEKLNELGL